MVVNKYNSIAEWRNENPKEYTQAYRKGWINQIRKIMGWQNQKQEKWTKERCIEIGKKYNSSGEWRKNDKPSYDKACAYGWLNEIKIESGWEGPRQKKVKPRRYWTKERCLEEVKKYTTVTEWGKGSGGSRVAAGRNGWYEECKEIINNKYEKI
jgi:hypothetical protein